MNTSAFEKARRKYREELSRHEMEFLNRIRQLDDVLWDRPFTAEEKQLRRRYVDELGKIRTEQFFLAEVDIREFDQQQVIQDLIVHFSNLKEDLKDRQSELEALVGRINTATKVVNTLEKVVQKLAGLLV